MGYNIVKYREECVILQIHFHPDVFMDLFSDSLRDNQLYFLLDLTIGTEKFYPRADVYILQDQQGDRAHVG